VIVKPALLLVDLQNDFLRMPGLEPHPAGVIAAAARLLATCRSADVPVVHVWSTVSREADNRMAHRKIRDEWTCVEGTVGHACPDDLRPRKAETIIHKSFFSGFSTGQLEPVLRAVEADLLIIAGVHLHACVRATALDAYAKGCAVLIAEDGAASDDPLHAAMTRRYLQDRCVFFKSSEEIAGVLGAIPANFEQLCVHKNREVISHTSPQDADRAWQLTVAKKSEITALRATAERAFSKWRETPANERLKTLQTFADSLQEEEKELIELLVEDAGKPIRYARAEVGRALALIAAASKQLLPEQGGRSQRTGYRRQPLGIVALISPFNNPLAIPIGKIVPALLYGNIVVWKPAIPGSRIAKKTAECFASATGRPELMQVVFGDNEVAREVMEACDAVTISGSLKAGYAAQEICGRRHIPLQAELGGNNASIVWRDADLAAASAAITEGAFAFGGQRCTANRRAVVDAAIYDSFLEKLIGAASGVVWGDPRNEGTHLGALISAASGRRVEAVIERARVSSHRVITPVESLNDHRGDQWVAPAIICCDDPNAEIVQEETFGPVLVVQSAKNWDEAISLCNGVKQGLVAALFAASPRLIDDFLRRAEAGIAKINSSTADAAVDLPFGGWKASGIGPPEHYPANHEFFTRWQAIYFPSGELNP
jgi:acyl-CoA reductase-like NAD-dependent aldehyde dehydrogenase/nicotinamidase-related amidase